jgi:hypothetical protein
MRAIVKETSSVAESPRAHSITNNHAERIPSGCAIARRGTTKLQISLIPLGHLNHLPNYRVDRMLSEEHALSAIKFYPKLLGLYALN